jgi:hypothetical protein
MTDEAFYFLKGLLALAASLLLIPHVWTAMAHGLSLGRQLRYLSLFVASVFLTSASAQQVQSDLPLDLRAIQGGILAPLILAAAAVSLWEDGHRLRRPWETSQEPSQRRHKK